MNMNLEPEGLSSEDPPHSHTNFGKVQLERGQDGGPELRLGIKSWPVTRCMTFSAGTGPC